MASVYIENYGCAANYDDGAIMAGLLLSENHSVVNDPEEADVLIINSCAVKNKTVNKISYRIEKFSDKKLIITGCMSIAEKERIGKLNPNASLVSTQNIIYIADIVNKAIKNEQVILTSKNKKSKLNLPKYIESKVVSVQIGSGCRSYCSFCSTKLAKGDLVSYPKEEIVKEIKSYLDKGYNEFNLTSTDNGCYGFDLGYDLADLVNEICLLDKDFTFRVGMANPQHFKFITNKLVESFKNSKVKKFLHIPVQSGSNKVLKEMRRKYSVEEFKYIVNEFRKEIPGVTVSSDIIVGYPTENIEDFEKTVELVKELKFEVLNISKFASRPKTLGSKLKPLQSQVVKERSKILNDIYWEYRKT